jgi:hypothetical protein
MPKPPELQTDLYFGGPNSANPEELLRARKHLHILPGSRHGIAPI